MDELFGLPAHPLLVHGAVVLVPLAALGVVITAFWPAARSRLWIAVVAIALVGTITTYLAAESGGSLEHDVRETDLVEQHAELGDSGLAASAAVLVAALGVAGFGLYERRRSQTAKADVADGDRQGEGQSGSDGRTVGLRVAIGVVAVTLAVAGTVQIARIGHSGAKAVWNDTAPGGQETDDD